MSLPPSAPVRRRPPTVQAVEEPDGPPSGPWVPPADPIPSQLRRWEPDTPPPIDVTVIVATFGDARWPALALERAIPSARDQAPVIQFHGDVLDTYGASLAECRNRAAAETSSEWLCFLDADDELRPGFFEAMARAEGDLRGPATEYVRNERVRPAMFWPQSDIRHSNFLLVSTLIRREMFVDVGGFRDVPMYEDWDLFQRCSNAGAAITLVPAAIVRVYINLGSVHRNGSNRAEKVAAYEHVRRLNYPELYE